MRPMHVEATRGQNLDLRPGPYILPAKISIFEMGWFLAAGADSPGLTLCKLASRVERRMGRLCDGFGWVYRR